MITVTVRVSEKMIEVLSVIILYNVNKIILFIQISN